MQIEFDLTDPTVVIAKADTRHDAYDLGALQATLVAAGRTVEVVSVDPGSPPEADYIALRLSLT